MASRSKKPASRGFVNNIILESLIHGDKYGYEIIKEVEEKSDGKILLKQPSLYSSLKRFESKGYITSYWGDSDIGGRRHYYTITEVGRQFFNGVKNGTAIALDEDDDADDEMTNLSVEDVLEEEQLTPDTMEPIHKVTTEMELEPASPVNATTIPSALDEWEPNELSEEDDDYDVFALLNKQPQPIPTTKPVAEMGIQATMFTSNEHNTTPQLMDEQVVNKHELHQTKEQNGFETDEEIVNEMEMFDHASIPLIKEENDNLLNPEKLTNKLVLEQKVETTNFIPSPVSNNEPQEVEQEETAHITSLETEPKQVSEPLQEISPVKTPKPLKVVVDEFGILKSADDTLPRKPKPLIDNVGVRIESKDPLAKLTSKKQKNEQVIKFEIETKPVAEFNDQLSHLTQKINKAMETRKQKTNEIDFKNIMGDLVVSDDEVLKPKAKPTSSPAPSINYEPEEEMVAYEPRPSKNTSFAALQQSLKQNGFTFKPYECEISESEKKTDFALVNKMKMHLGVLLFLLTVLQVTIFTLTLTSIGYAFKNIDYVFIGFGYFVGALVMLFLTIPYFVSSQKRKFSSFIMGQNLFFGLLTLLSVSIISYAINSLVGLTFQNIDQYIVTLFMPILLTINCIVAPFAYRVLQNNKRYY